ncbi:MAG TPA: hypothetical protein VEB63_02120, partial [Chitinophagaceae bacterium]|nr:hypothetical protein [Chitinophagaceae bacterium]
LYVIVFMKIPGAGSQSSTSEGRRRALFFVTLGFTVFLLGALPFSLVFKPVIFYPNGATWMHQCNLYLGAALLLYGLVSLLGSGRVRAMLVCAIVSVFILAGFRSFLLHNKQWLKEESIVVNFRKTDPIRSGRSFLIDDNVKELNSSHLIQFFTFNALMKRAFEDETRFAVTRDEMRSWLTHPEIFDSTIFDPSRRQFAMSDYVPQRFQYNVKIEKGKGELADFKAVKLLWYSWFDKNRFNAEIADVVSLRIFPCTGCPAIAQTGNSLDKTSIGK